MASKPWDLTSHNEYDLGVASPGSLDTNGTEELDDGVLAHLIDGQERGFRLHDMSSAASKSSIHQLTFSPLGKPTKKQRLHAFDAFAAGLTIFCAVLAIMAVANNNFSWRLGVANYQLIVIGFLLSIMNLCLGTVAPVLFLLLEAKLGPSIVQNYDAILRNKPLAPRLNIFWRGVLGIMLALPIALSIAYKTFTGGESALEVIDSDYISKASFYGFFPPPGLKTIGVAQASQSSSTQPCRSWSHRH